MNASHIVLAASGGRGFHSGGGFGILIVLVIAALGFGFVRLRNRKDAQIRDDEWRRSPQRSEPSPTEPRGTAGDAPPAAAVPGQAAAEDRVPRIARPAVALGNAGGGWAVETHGLTKRFGSNVAVDDVELLVPRGCAFGYLGPNGAGKTTLIRTLLGLTRANNGTMSLLGCPSRPSVAGPWPGWARSSTNPAFTPI